MPHPGTITRPEEALLGLLRAALWETPAGETPFRELAPAEWDEVFAAAIRQGVQAIAFDGVLRLPEALRPPRTLKLQWGLNAAAAEKRFAHYLGATQKLAAFYGKHGIRTLVLKGVGLAMDFPVPHHRESGDIDLWLFGRHDEGMRLAAAEFGPVEIANDKHTCFLFDGIPVENHRHFLDLDLYKMNRELEPLLHTLLENNACPPLFPAGGNGSTPGPCIPPADFNALFLLRHMSAHFAAGGIRLRHLCDWARFLFAHGHEMDTESFRSTLHTVGLERIAGAFGLLAAEYLGLPGRFLPDTGIPDRELARRVLDDTLHGNRPITARNPLRILAVKTKRFLSVQWKYDAVYGHGGGLGVRLRLSVRSHVRRPRNILKT